MKQSSFLTGITRPGFADTPLRNPVSHNPLKLQNRVQMEVWGPDGSNPKPQRKARVDHYGNVMATYGLNRLVEMLVSDTDGASAFANHMAIGTHTRAENSTDSNLGASTQIVTISRSDQGNLTYRALATFASDNNAASIHEVGLFQTNVATNSMIARSELGTDSVNRGASDEIRVSYDIIASTA